jgi:fluoroacetyl-CoA thioesterase
MGSLEVGLKAEMQRAVDDSNAISFLGEGGPRVLATPALIMFLEMTSRDLAKAHLDAGYDTVGTHVDVKHLAATPIGMMVTFHSELIEAKDRKLRFRVEAFDAKEKTADGFHERAIINVAKFAARVMAKARE